MERSRVPNPKPPRIIKSRHHHHHSAKDGSQHGSTDSNNEKDPLENGTDDEEPPYDGPKAFCVSLPAIQILWHEAELEANAFLRKSARFMRTAEARVTDAQWATSRGAVGHRYRIQKFLLAQKSDPLLVGDLPFKLIRNSFQSPNPATASTSNRSGRRIQVESRVAMRLIPKIFARGEKLRMVVNPPKQAETIQCCPTLHGNLIRKSLCTWKPPECLRGFVPSLVAKLRHGKSKGRYWIVCPCWNLHPKSLSLMLSQGPTEFVPSVLAAKKLKGCAGFTLPHLNETITCTAELRQMRGIRQTLASEECSRKPARIDVDKDDESDGSSSDDASSSLDGFEMEDESDDEATGSGDREVVLDQPQIEMVLKTMQIHDKPSKDVDVEEAEFRSQLVHGSEDDRDEEEDYYLFSNKSDLMIALVDRNMVWPLVTCVIPRGHLEALDKEERRNTIDTDGEEEGEDAFVTDLGLIANASPRGWKMWGLA